MSTTRVLAICGSLRAQSTNSTLIQWLALAAPDDVTVDVFDGLAAR